MFIINIVGIHVTILGHWISNVRKPGRKYKLLDIVGYMSFFTKNEYAYLFTMKEYITVQLTSAIQRQWFLLPDASTNVITATVWYRRKRRSLLSKEPNLLYKIAFSRLCHSEFVYDTGGVYFKQNVML